MSSKPTMDINTFTESEKLLLLIGNKIIDATNFCHKHPGHILFLVRCQSFLLLSFAMLSFSLTYASILFKFLS